MKLWVIETIVENHSFCSMSSLFFFMALFFFFFPSSVANQAEGFTACAPFSCGYLDNLTYPFWSSNQPDYCGHPSFKLDCQDMVTIEIKSQKFLVIEINQTSQMFNITPFDLFNLNHTCPKLSLNVDLDLTFFTYTSNNNNYTLLYDCNPIPSTSPLDSTSIPFSCLTNGHTHKGYFVSTTNVVNLGDLMCKNNITLPILRDALEKSIPSSMFIESILTEGSEVRWNGVDEEKCIYDCVKSGGRCGYNTSTNVFMCLCHNRQHYGVSCIETKPPMPTPSPRNAPHSKSEDSHHATSQWRWGRKEIISVVSIVLGAIAVITIGIYFYWRRAKSYVESQNLPSTASADPERESRLIGVHLFSYAELEQATDNFDSSREIGDGGYGTVYFGKLRDGRCVAVKKLYEHNSRRLEQFMNEAEILTRLVHPNLVSLYGCTSRHNRELLLVYEYIPNGTVADHLHGKFSNLGKLSWHTRMSIAVETASALKYLHVSEIVHRDVKTSNILLDGHFHVKVADFGISRLFPNDVTHVLTDPQGTLGYVDPEYHRCCQLTSKSDVYSFGVVLIELISSLPVVDLTRQYDEINLSDMAVNKIQNQAFHELVDSRLGFDSDNRVKEMIIVVAELAYQCLQSSKNMRPSMDEVLNTLLGIQDDPSPPSPDSNEVSNYVTPDASG